MIRAISLSSLAVSLVAGGCGGPPQEDAAPASSSAVAAATCATLRPTSFPAAPVVNIPIGTHRACGEATTSPGGQVAIGIRLGGEIDVSLFSSTGAGDPNVAQIQPLVPVGGADMDPWFHFTSSGWRGIVGPPGQQLDTWTTAGALVSAITTRNDFWSAPDGQGGTVAVGGDASTGAPVLSWIDAGGAIRREVSLDRAAGLVLVNWATGHVLIIADGPGAPPSTANARWFDGAGRALTPWFTTHVTVGGASAMLHLLRDGRPALAVDGVWQVAFHDGSTVVDHAPSWLASRPGKRLASIPGGYAVLTDVSTGVATPTVEILTADGQSCGFLSPPGRAPPPGADMSIDRYRVGQDGTLLELAAVDGLAGGPNDNFCSTRWWPKLFVSR